MIATASGASGHHAQGAGQRKCKAKHAGLPACVFAEGVAGNVTYQPRQKAADLKNRPTHAYQLVLGDRLADTNQSRGQRWKVALAPREVLAFLPKERLVTER